MSRPFLPLSTLDDLDRAILASSTRPILIFKHSPSCGTSAMAHEELSDVLDNDLEPLPADVYLVHLQAARDVSAEITHRFHVRHESPQVLLIKNGTVVWHASHFRATAANIRATLGRFTVA